MHIHTYKHIYIYTHTHTHTHKYKSTYIHTHIRTPRRRYPFDPDNPVPKGVTLAPKDLRAKYYKVIDPNAKFFVGDPRLLRDRRNERDPKRTNYYKKLRADSQEVYE